MKIEETNVKNAIEINEYGQPYINPYYGCSAGCPFCYWLSIKGWEGKIEVRLNIAERLEEYCLSMGEKKERVYIGSYCDPYMEEVEPQYGLTRECLKVLAKYNIPVTICTSARSKIVLRDLDLFVQMKRLAVITELCRLDQMDQLQKKKEHMGIAVANQLYADGISVCATFAPILPGIADVEEIREKLNPEITIYVDKLYAEPGTIQEERVMELVEQKRPELLAVYQEYLNGEHKELDTYVKKYIGNKNIRAFPIEE
ncbi:MAG: hypothetical protein PHR92_15825 [Lachnospiraceae bacterium]|nr:hypothetical protein [Lachnospiraceae bacterium]